MAREVEFGPTVDSKTRTLRRTSVSAVTMFDPAEYGGCNRAWYFNKVRGLLKPDTISTTTGKEVHAQNEHYQKTGEDVLGLVARQGKHFLLPPGPGLLVEQEFGGTELWKRVGEAVASGLEKPDAASQWRMRTINSAGLVAHGVPFVGYIDNVNTRDYWLDNDGERRPMPPHCVEVHDHKTAKSIADYAKTGESLANTVQMVGYGKWVSVQFPHVTQVRLSHGYLQTKGRGASKRTTLISVDDVLNRWQRVEHQVSRMIQVARETDPNRVEANYESCDAYNPSGRADRGCPFKSVCERPPQQTLFDLIGDESAMSLMDMLQGSAGVPAQTPAAPAQSPPAAPAGAALCACGQPVDDKNVAALPTGQKYHMVGVPHLLSLAVPGALTAGAPSGEGDVGMRQGTPVAAPPAGGGMLAALTGMVSVPAGGASPVAPSVTPLPSPVATVPARANVPFRDGLLLRQRIGGQQVRIYQHAGEWYQQDIPASGAVGATSGTKPEQWFADVWEEIAQSPAAPVNAVAPPDAPQSVPPGNAEAVPPGTVVLSPSVAAVVAQHAAQSAPATAAPAAATVEEKVTPLEDWGGRVQAWWTTWAMCAASAAASPTFAEIAQGALGVAPEAVNQSVKVQLGKVLTKLGWTGSQKAGVKRYAPPGVAVRHPAGEAATKLGESPAAGSSAGESFSGGSVIGGDAEPGMEQLLLFVDCSTVTLSGFEVIDLEHWIAGLCAKLAAAAKPPLEDIRMAGSDHPLGYNKWEGALAACVRAFPPKGICRIDHVSESRVKQIVVEALRPLATGGFVRGLGR